MIHSIHRSEAADPDPPATPPRAEELANRFRQQHEAETAGKWRSRPAGQVFPDRRGS